MGCACWEGRVSTGHFQLKFPEMQHSMCTAVRFVTGEHGVVRLEQAQPATQSPTPHLPPYNRLIFQQFPPEPVLRDGKQGDSLGPQPLGDPVGLWWVGDRRPRLQPLRKAPMHLMLHLLLSNSDQRLVLGEGQMIAPSCTIASQGRELPLNSAADLMMPWRLVTWFNFEPS